PAPTGWLYGPQDDSAAGARSVLLPSLAVGRLRRFPEFLGDGLDALGHRLFLVEVLLEATFPISSTSGVGCSSWSASCSLTPRHELLDTRVHWPVAEIDKAMMLHTPRVLATWGPAARFRGRMATMAIVST